MNLPNLLNEVWRDYDGVIGGGFTRADNLHIGWANHSNILRGAKSDGVTIRHILEIAILRHRLILDGQPDDNIIQNLQSLVDSIPEVPQGEPQGG